MLRGGAAERCGVSTGDELLAVDGWRFRRIDDALRLLRPGAAGTLLLSRDQRVLSLPLTMPKEDEAVGTITLTMDSKAQRPVAALRKAWFGG